MISPLIEPRQRTTGVSGVKSLSFHLPVSGTPPLRHPPVAGDDVFVVECLACVPRDPAFTRAMVRPPRPTLAELVGSTGDPEGIVTARIGHGYSLRQLVTHLGYSVTTVHHRVHHRGDEAAELAGACRGWYEEDLTPTSPNSRPSDVADDPNLRAMAQSSRRSTVEDRAPVAVAHETIAAVSADFGVPAADVEDYLRVALPLAS